MAHFGQARLTKAMSRWAQTPCLKKVSKQVRWCFGSQVLDLCQQSVSSLRWSLYVHICALCPPDWRSFFFSCVISKVKPYLSYPELHLVLVHFLGHNYHHTSRAFSVLVSLSGSMMKMEQIHSSEKNQYLEECPGPFLLGNFTSSGNELSHTVG